jgi:anthranilate synthase component 2
MILVIDNYDSFTYNLVQYLGELGAELSVYRNDQISIEQIRIRQPDGIIISPGPGRPENAGITVDVIRECCGEYPILGVCLGHQALGMAFGGQVVSAPLLMHGKTSKIYHKEQGLLAELSNPFVATRYHSLIVDRDSLPDDLLITAETTEGVIMGLQHKKYHVYGVQFHPESILTPEGKKLLGNFLKVCASQKGASS